MEETKKCPDCAEEIKAEARVCRFCGHRFTEGAGHSEPPVGDNRASAPKVEKSSALAVVLSLVLVGLGQFYIGAWRRGLAFAAAAVGTLLLAFIHPLLSLAVWVALIVWAAVDANTEARRFNAGMPLRGAGAWGWTAGGLFLAAVVAVVAVEASQGDGERSRISNPDGLEYEIDESGAGEPPAEPTETPLEFEVKESAPSGEDGSYVCRDFPTQEDAQVFIDSPDGEGEDEWIDNDQDGVACEPSERKLTGAG